MSLNGLHQFRNADTATALRMLREVQRQTLIIVAVRGLLFGVLLGVVIFLLTRNA